MDRSRCRVFGILFILGAATAVCSCRGKMSISGHVYCDQCRDGELTPTAYPISGAGVLLTCVDVYGNVPLRQETMTDKNGKYTCMFDGNPDLTTCNIVTLVNGDDETSCSADNGPSQSIKLARTLRSQMLDVSEYMVGPLFNYSPFIPDICKEQHPVPDCRSMYRKIDAV